MRTGRTSAPEVIRGVCPHDCPDTCSWKVAVNGQGRAVRLWGDPDHPVTRGRLCGKVDRYLERTYHEGRLATPLRRVGRKGEGRFEPCSWESAIDEVTARLAGVVAEHGAESVVPYSYAGTMGLLQGEGVASRFFHRLGASHLARTICSKAGFEGLSYTLGRAIGPDMEDFARARLILIWGSNTLTSNVHLWPFVQEARRAGGRVIVIDPACTRTARAADEWLPIRPGSDGALALAMMHVIIGEGRTDQAYVAAHTTGFEALAARVRDYPPEWAAELTGIPAPRIVALAREYAAEQPAMIRLNYGMQRHAGGGMATRSIACLPALVGAWRHRGGGIQLSTSGGFPFDLSMLYRPDLRRSPARTFNMNRLGDLLSPDPVRRARAHYRPRPVDPSVAPEASGPAVHALVVYNCNPATVAPDEQAVRAGLARDDLFTVVLEQFATDTVTYADIVLPATTQLEHWDLLKPYGHHYLALNRPAIAPLGQAQPNSEIFRRLAAGMGFDDPCFDESDEEILRAFVAAQQHPNFEGVSWEGLLESGFVRLNLPTPFLPFAEGGFPTESGRCEFYSARMARDGYDPLPCWLPPASLAPGEGEQPSLVCISPPAHSFLNSTFVNVPRLQAREGEPRLWIHPTDAASRGLVDGDRVRLWNERGEVVLCTRVTAEIVAGTVLAPGIWWASLSPDGRGINQITGQEESDMGGGATFYDARVRVERLPESGLD